MVRVFQFDQLVHFGNIRGPVNGQADRVPTPNALEQP